MRTIIHQSILSLFLYQQFSASYHLEEEKNGVFMYTGFLRENVVGPLNGDIAVTDGIGFRGDSGPGEECSAVWIDGAAKRYI